MNAKGRSNGARYAVETTIKDPRNSGRSPNFHLSAKMAVKQVFFTFALLVSVVASAPTSQVADAGDLRTASRPASGTSEGCAILDKHGNVKHQCPGPRDQCYWYVNWNSWRRDYFLIRCTPTGSWGKKMWGGSVKAVHGSGATLQACK